MRLGMEYAKFTREMKDTHTLLIPNMLPTHFKLFIKIFEQYGYKMELLETSSREVIDEGLQHVHNDACYPALLVIGQFIDALKSGKYDLDKTALILTQTGGGCRASNYIHLLRKAMAKEFSQIPVISLNFSGLEKDCGFQITMPMILKLAYAVLYGDMLMSVYNQTKPYELQKGDTDRALQKLFDEIAELLRRGKYRNTKKVYELIIKTFRNVKQSPLKKPKVGIVGEIYVKYSPLANNHLEEFLISEGCEPVVPGLLDFCLYCIVNCINDHELYGLNRKSILIYRFLYWFLYRKQREVIKVMREYHLYAPHDFEELRANADRFINQGVKMGEGWLIPAEMVSLAETGVQNIVCAQPFGCLPNHIVGKGMIRPIKEAYPEENIVAIDYDSGATKVNQENRIKLMLSNIKK